MTSKLKMVFHDKGQSFKTENSSSVFKIVYINPGDRPCGCMFFGIFNLTVVFHDNKSIYHKLNIRWQFCFLEILVCFPCISSREIATKTGTFFELTIFQLTTIWNQFREHLMLWDRIVYLSWQKTDYVYHHDRKLIGLPHYWPEIPTKLFPTDHFGPWGMQNYFWCWNFW